MHSVRVNIARIIVYKHKEALKQDPTVNLPLMTYLEER